MNFWVPVPEESTAFRAATSFSTYTNATAGEIAVDDFGYVLETDNK